MGSNSKYCYSGGADTRIHSWKIPDLNMDPYDGYDPSVLSYVLEGLGDVVWGLAFSPISHRLASCSADGTVRIWDPSSSSPSCHCTFPMSGEHRIPTSAAFTSTESAHVVASFPSGDTVFMTWKLAVPSSHWSPEGAAAQHRPTRWRVTQISPSPLLRTTIGASDSWTIGQVNLCTPWLPTWTQSPA
ncbi:Strn4 [Lemmus lemmus]